MKFISQKSSLIYILFFSIILFSTQVLSQEIFDEAAKMVYESGKKSYQEGNYKKALEDFEKAYEVVKNPYIEFYLARCYQKLNNCEEAIKYWEKVSGKFSGIYQEEVEGSKKICKTRLTEFPTDTPDHKAAHLLFEQGVSFFNQGKHDEGIKTFSKCLTLAPDIPIIHYYLGKSYTETGDCINGIEHFNAVKWKMPKYLEEINKWIKICSIYNSVRPTEVNEGLRKKLFLMYKSGVSFLYDGKLIDANKTFDGAFELYDNFKIKMEIADLYLELKIYNHALPLYKSLLKKVPAYDNIIENKIEECSILMAEKQEKHREVELVSAYKQGKELFMQKNYSKALEIFEKYINNPYFQLFIGKIHFETGNYKEAIKAYSSVSKALPDLKNEIENRLNIAHFLIHDENAEPNKELIYKQYAKGKQFYDSGEYEKAKEILSIYSKNPYISLYLARINMKLKKYNEAFDNWLNLKGKLPEYNKEVDEEISSCQGHFESYYLKKRLGWIFTSVGGAMILTSSYFFYKYFDAVSSYDGAMDKYNSAYNPDDTIKYREQVNENNSKMKTNSAVAISLISAGSAVLAFGIYNFITLPERPEFREEKAVSILPVLKDFRFLALDFKF